jgi:hypothetical protein
VLLLLQRRDARPRRRRRRALGRALHVVYSTSHTSSSSDWLKDLSPNEKAE